uniref:RNA-dependent RNA polymerase n=1 Tax=Camula virus TaxID=1960157 RepID=A0A1S6G680_9VIRU|nr:RNA-dependent RNA polymerase [Camula virus]
MLKAAQSSVRADRVKWSSLCRHYLHNAWGRSVCMDNYIQYTTDVVVEGCPYTPDLVIGGVAYDFAVTAAPDLSLNNKTKKYTPYFDGFFLIPYCINSTSVPYLSAANMVWGQACTAFDKFMNFSKDTYASWGGFLEEETVDVKPAPLYELQTANFQVLPRSVHGDFKKVLHEAIQKQQCDANSKFVVSLNQKGNPSLVPSSEGYTLEEISNSLNQPLDRCLRSLNLITIVWSEEETETMYNSKEYLHSELYFDDEVRSPPISFMTKDNPMTPGEVLKKLEEQVEHTQGTSFLDYPMSVSLHVDEQLKALSELPVEGASEWSIFPVLDCPVKQKKWCFYGKTVVVPKHETGNGVSDTKKAGLYKETAPNEFKKEIYNLAKAGQDYINVMMEADEKGLWAQLESGQSCPDKELQEKYQAAKSTLKTVSKKIVKEEKHRHRNQFYPTKLHLEEIKKNTNHKRVGCPYLLDEIDINYQEAVCWLFKIDEQPKEVPDLPRLMLSEPNLHPLIQDVIKWDNELQNHLITLSKYRLWRAVCTISSVCKSIICMSQYSSPNKDGVFFDVDRDGGYCLLVNARSPGLGSGQSKAFMILSKELNNPFTDNVNNYVSEGVFHHHWRYLRNEQLVYGLQLPMHLFKVYSGLMSEGVISSPRDELFQTLTMLMLDCRRRTETFLHDMKYLTFNLSGLRASTRELFKDKFVPPIHPMLEYLEKKFLNGVGQYLESVKVCERQLDYSRSSAYVKLQHPLSNHLDTLPKFSYWVYISYCMSKGVFKKETEHVRNMLSITENHAYAHSVTRGAQGKDNFLQATQKYDIIKDMVSYNPRVLASVLQYGLAIWANSYQCSKLYSLWETWKQNPVTEIATSSSMRQSNFDQTGNFGGNGHVIMCNYLSLHYQPPNISSVSTALEYSTGRKMIREAEITVQEYREQTPDYQCKFSFSDKVQWGGSREIYIETMEMKARQYYIEKALAELCKSMPNELIHVPSAKRLSVLYEKVKSRRKGTTRYYLTLDCKRWAPLSNCGKFQQLFESYYNYLPGGLVQMAREYFDRYYEKRLIVDNMTGAKFVKDHPEYSEFWSIQENGLYYMTMPESFMMGMFNYLSSYVHSIVQLYFTHVLVPALEKEFHCNITMELFAHSDDSGGWMDISSDMCDKVAITVARLYEELLRMTNHTLSPKKCVLSKSYFEIISNIFISSDVLPVCAKQIYSFSIPVTQKGPIEGMLSLNGQVREALTAGASMRTSYYCGQCSAYSLLATWNCRLDPNWKIVHPALGGLITAHPLLTLYHPKEAENVFSYLLGGGRYEQFCRWNAETYKGIPKLHYLSYDFRQSKRVQKMISVISNLCPEVVCGDMSITPNTSCLAYLYRMKAMLKKTALNDIFGESFTTTLNTCRIQSRPAPYYSLAGLVSSYDQTRLIYLSFEEEQYPCPVIEDSYRYWRQGVPRADYLQPKPCHIKAENWNPSYYNNRLQTLKQMQTKMPALFCLTAEPIEVPTVLALGEDVMTSWFPPGMFDNPNIDIWMVARTPTRYMYGLTSAVYVYSFNCMPGYNLDFQILAPGYDLKENALASLVRLIILNHLTEEELSSCTIQGKSVIGWLKNNNIPSYAALKNSCGMTQIQRVQFKSSDGDWFGKTNVIGRYMGISFLAECTGSYVINLSIATRVSSLIKQVCLVLAQSGFKFVRKIGYTNNYIGFYLDNEGNYLYSEEPSPHPMIKNLTYAPNLVTYCKPTPWFWDKKSKTTEWNYPGNTTERLTLQDSSGKTLKYNSFGERQRLSLSPECKMENIRNWYTSGELFKNFSRDNKLLAIKQVNDNRPLLRGINPKTPYFDWNNQGLCIETLNLMSKSCVLMKGNGKYVMVGKDSLESIQNNCTDLVFFNAESLSYYNSCGSPTNDNTIWNMAVGNYLFDFRNEFFGLMKPEDFLLLSNLINTYTAWFKDGFFREAPDSPPLWGMVKKLCSQKPAGFWADSKKVYILLRNCLFGGSAESIEQAGSFCKMLIKRSKGWLGKNFIKSGTIYNCKLGLIPRVGCAYTDIEHALDCGQYEMEFEEEFEEEMYDPDLAVQTMSELIPNWNFYTKEEFESKYPYCNGDYGFVVQDSGPGDLPYSENIDIAGSFTKKSSNEELINAIFKRKKAAEPCTPSDVIVIQLYREGIISAEEANQQLGGEFIVQNSIKEWFMKQTVDGGVPWTLFLNKLQESADIDIRSKDPGGVEFDAKAVAELERISKSYANLLFKGWNELTPSMATTLTNLIGSALNLETEFKDLLYRMVADCKVVPSNETSTNSLLTLNSIMEVFSQLIPKDRGLFGEVLPEAGSIKLNYI